MTGAPALVGPLLAGVRTIVGSECPATVRGDEAARTVGGDGEQAVDGIPIHPRWNGEEVDRGSSNGLVYDLTEEFRHCRT